MDIRKIKKLIELLEESSLTEIEIVEGEESVRLARGGQLQSVQHVAPQMVAPAAAAPAPQAVTAETPKTDDEEVPEGELVLSPMVGTFFAASGPGAEPFVSLGQRVGVGDTLCSTRSSQMWRELSWQYWSKMANRLNTTSHCS